MSTGTYREDPRFLAVCLNPTLQKTLVFETFALNEVNRVVQERLDASGKGVNVARVLRELGQPVTHLTHLGGETRAAFEALCGADEVPLEIIECDTPIRTCTTIIDRQVHTTTEIVEPTRPVDAATEEELVNRFRSLLVHHSVVIFSGSMAPGYATDLYARLTRDAREAGLYVIADYRGGPLKAALNNPPNFRPNLIKPNLKEFAETFFSGGAAAISEHADDPETLERAHREMVRLVGEGITTVITRGGNPALAVGAEGTLEQYPPMQITPVNTIGCGDAFTAGLAAELAAGHGMAEAIERGHAAAAMNASNLKPGSIRPEHG